MLLQRRAKAQQEVNLGLVERFIYFQFPCPTSTIEITEKGEKYVQTQQ